MEMRAAYAECMAKLMEQDPKVIVLDADLANSTAMRKLYPRFPKQMFECGIAEQSMCSIAAGLSSYGFKPYIETFAPFASRRICDQVSISVAYAKQNVKIVGTDGGIGAELNGGTHMSVEDIAVLRSIPGIIIFEPCDEIQVRKAIPVINSYQGPVYIRLFRKELPAVFTEDYQFELFKADLLKPGKDLSVFVSGIPVFDTLEAAKELEAEGIKCEVINVHTIKPVDRETVLSSAKKTGAALTVENHNVIGGLHSAITETLSRERIPCYAVGIEDRFCEVGKLPYLKETFGFTKENIKNAMRNAFNSK